VQHASLALLVSLVVACAPRESSEPTKIRITTWNLEWFPNGSAHDATPEVQAKRIAAAADVLRPINPDIILLQEVRDYEACARLGEAIAPGMYHVAICSGFKEPFQSGLGKQQVAILSKYQAQAAWAEPWKSMNGVDPPRGFSFAWFKIGNDDLGVYSVHLKSNLITHGDREAETAKNIRKREVAIAQLLTHIHDVIGTTIPTVKAIVIGGRFQYKS
jgi:endonuclease/exonuclease/phosphatase family metal-dependent hydrolase